jgi:hypothetical protein
MFLKKSQLILAGLLVVMASAGISYAVSASVPSTLLPAGTTMYAFTQRQDQLNITSAQILHWVSAAVPLSVTIPPGKVADVVVLFCSLANADSQFIRVKSAIGTTLLEPSSAGFGLNLIAGAGAQNQCISFQKASVAAGTMYVNVYWLAVTVNSHLYNRSLVAILNIH